MWSWTDPIAEIVGAFLNRLGYIFIEDLNGEMVNHDIKAGLLSLRNLRFKKSTLCNFRLPVTVQEGYLGKFTISIPWKSLGSKLVEISVEDMYILLTPTTNIIVDQDDDEHYTAKNVSSEKQRFKYEDTARSQHFVGSLIMKIVNTLQVTVKNIHVRYEDGINRPGHLFAAGISLDEFTATSVDETFKQSTKIIHKLARLESLAIYLDTDTTSTVGVPAQEALSELASLVSSSDPRLMHQFILRPVTGEGRISMEKEEEEKILKTNVQLLFHDVGVSFDNNQYGELITLFERYHLHLRRQQYRADAPAQLDIDKNRPRALLRFAGKVILREIHEKNEKWTLSYIKKVGAQRRSYMTLFRKKCLDQLSSEDRAALEAMERKLTCEDIQLYEHLTRLQIRNGIRARTLRSGGQRKDTQITGTSNDTPWSIAWLFGRLVDYSSGKTPPKTGALLDERFWNITDARLNELHWRSLERDEADGVVDVLSLSVTTKIKHASVSVKSCLAGRKGRDIISVVFEDFKNDIKRVPTNDQITVTLGTFYVLDCTTDSTSYPQVVHMYEWPSHQITEEIPREDKDGDEDALLYFKVEKFPLDHSSGVSLVFQLKRLEIIYHKACIEAIHQFLHPSGCPPESTEVLLRTTIDFIFNWPRKKIQAGFNYTVYTHEAIALKIDLQTPIIIIPENISSKDGPHLIIDAGRVTFASNDATHEVDSTIHSPEGEDLKFLGDRTNRFFNLELHALQFLLGPNYQTCIEALELPDAQTTYHIIERVNIELKIRIFLLPRRISKALKLPRDPRIRVSGTLSRLQFNISDTKYKAIERFINSSIIPMFTEHEPDSDSPHPWPGGPTVSRSPTYPNFELYETDYDFDDDHAGKEPVIDTERKSIIMSELQSVFKLNFKILHFQMNVSKLNLDGIEERLGELRLESFQLNYALKLLTATVSLMLRSLVMNLKQVEDDRIVLISSKSKASETEEDLMTVANGLWNVFKATFVPEKSSKDPPSSCPNHTEDPKDLQRRPPWSNRIGITVDPASVHVSLTPPATLGLSTSNVSVTVRGNSIRVNILRTVFAWALVYYWQLLGKVLLSDSQDRDSTVPSTPSSFK